MMRVPRAANHEFVQSRLSPTPDAPATARVRYEFAAVKRSRAVSARTVVAPGALMKAPDFR